MASKALMRRVLELQCGPDKLNLSETGAQLEAEEWVDPGWNGNSRHMAQLDDATGKWILGQLKDLDDLRAKDRPYRQVEDQLCERYNLLAARVVPGGHVSNPMKYAGLIQRYGRAAAEYFDDLANQAEEKDEELYVAVSGGQTILEMVRPTHPRAPQRFLSQRRFDWTWTQDEDRAYWA